MSRVAQRSFVLLFASAGLGLPALVGCSSSDSSGSPSDSGDASAGPDAGDAAEVSDAGEEPDASDGACSFFDPALDDPTPAPVHTPRWAFEPWISKDISDAADTRAFVDGFRQRDIPVGAVVIDSPWESNYNTLVPDPVRYPDFGGMVAELRAKGVRTVVWTTQMINWTSLDLEPGGSKYDGAAPSYDAALACGFFVDDGKSWPWWKGKGGAIDFFSNDARGFWHRQQDALFDLGVAGFKLDFGDSYVRSDPVKTHAGAVAHQAYSEEYYKDFYAYGMSRHDPGEFVTMVRPWDASYEFAGRFYARPEHAPVAWVGDNRRDWVGLADALDSSFRSARAGYPVVGSDVGGYLDRDDQNLLGPTIPFSTLVFARWTAASALLPFMQLHGRANITPWTVPDSVDQTVALYRYWSKLHHALVPFFASLAEETRAGHAKLLDPIGTDPGWAGDFRWNLGAAFLVAPVLEDTGVRDVALPAGARYYDWWVPGGDAIAGGTTLTAYDASAREKLPLFVREGAIVPLQVEDDVLGLGTAASAGALTIAAWPGSTASSFVLHEADGSVTSIGAHVTGGDTVVGIDRALATTIFRVRVAAAPSGASVASGALAEHATRAAFDAATSGWFWEPATKCVWAKVAAAPAGATLTIAGPVAR